MTGESLGQSVTGFEAAKTCDLGLESVVAIGRLRGVGVAGGALYGFDGCDVHVRIGPEHLCVFSVGDFVEIERETAAEFVPGVVSEIRDGAVIGVIIDRPVGENGVRFFGGEQFAKFVVVRAIDDCVCIALGGERGARMQDFAGFARFGDTGVGFGVRVRAGLLAAVEIEQNDFVAGGGIARDRAATAVFGITRMAAGDHDFQLACLGSEGRENGRGGEKSTSGESHFRCEYIER